MSPPGTAAEGPRIPSLDGIRAISIAIVLLEHLFGTRGFPISRELARSLRLGDYGHLGVTIFFVISGFLITTLLLSEHERTGTVSLRLFYFRRTLRIFPAFYVFVFVVGLLWAAGVVRLLDGDLFHALTYTMNYHRERSWYLGHIWSLSTEEQFYLLWPAVILVLGVRGGLRAAALCVVVVPAIRALTWVFHPESRSSLHEMFHTSCDALAVGCLLGGWRGRLDSLPGYAAFLRSRTFVLVPGVVLVGPVFLDMHPRLDLVGGTTVINIAIALCIDWLLRNPGTAVARTLNWRPLAFVGTLSYSVYLWQELFLNRRVDTAVTAFPLNLVLVAVCAVASYFLVERPFLELRRRLTPRMTAARAAGGGGS